MLPVPGSPLSGPVSFSPAGHFLPLWWCRELALRLSGLAIRYPAPGQFAGLRVPEKFLLLTQGTATDVPARYGDRLDLVTAELTANGPEWAGVRSMPIRPDGSVSWAADTDDVAPLNAWLGTALAHTSLTCRRADVPVLNLYALSWMPRRLQRSSIQACRATVSMPIAQ